MKRRYSVGGRWWHALFMLVMLACLAPLVACGVSVQGTSGASDTPSASSTPSAPAHGTLDGEVVASPTCPVESASNPCAPKPVTSRAVAIVGSNGQNVAKTTTDGQGHFSLELAPGTYTVKVAIIPGMVGMRQVTPAKVTIISGQTTKITIVLDTGIR